jgi:hypothetical protein
MFPPRFFLNHPERLELGVEGFTDTRSNHALWMGTRPAAQWRLLEIRGDEPLALSRTDSILNHAPPRGAEA